MSHTFYSVTVALIVVACGSSTVVAPQATDGGGEASTDVTDAATSTDVTDAATSTDVTDAATSTDVTDAATSTDVTDAAMCPSEPTPNCQSARHIASVQDFLDIVRPIPWHPVSDAVNAVLALTDDLVADVDLDVDASMLAGPTSCVTGDAGLSKCHAPLFSEAVYPRRNSKGRVAGVTCIQDGDLGVFWGDSCAHITIVKGTVFRLSGVIRDLHPRAPTYWPVLGIERACAAACDSGETRCAANQMCFTPVGKCGYCEGLAPSICACRNSCGPKPDGASCTFATSPDTEANGTCSSGTCGSKQ